MIIQALRLAVLAFWLFGFSHGATVLMRTHPPLTGAAGGGGGAGWPEIDSSVATNSVATTQTHLVAIPVGTGANRVLVVQAVWSGAAARSLAVTAHRPGGAGSSALTLFGKQQVMTFAATNATFYLIAPTSGETLTLSNRFSGDITEIAYVASIVTNCNQTTPLASFASSTHTLRGITNTVTSLTAGRDSALDQFNYYATTGFSWTPGTGQRQFTNSIAAADTFSLRCSIMTNILTTSTNMYWLEDTADSADLSHAAMALKGVP